MQDLKLTMLQGDLAWQNPTANREHYGPLIAEQAPTSDLIVLPEMFNTGFTMDAETHAEETDGPTTNWLQAMAREHRTALCGSLIITASDRYYNRLIWAHPDGHIESYDKRHLFRMAEEDKHYSAGSSRLVVELLGWKICPLICYDLRFPVWSRNNNDYDLVLYVANWPAARRSAWDTLLPARAVENLCYSAGLNRTGTDGNGISYDGGSVICDFLGHKLTKADETAQTVSATLDAGKLQRYRRKFPAWKDADTFEIH